MADDNAYRAPQAIELSQQQQQPPRKKTTLGKRLVELAVVVAIILILIGMLLPAVRQVRPMARRTACMNNIRQITLAILNYESANGHFPPAYLTDDAGKPIHSWRVLILPFMEQDALYQQYSFNEPWDGPNNSKLHNAIVSQYQCPSTANEKSVLCSNYMAVIGDRTVMSGQRKTKFSDITDGSSQTLLLIEVPNSDTHWMQPIDVPLDQALVRLADPEKYDRCCNHMGGVNVACADGSCHFLTLPVKAEDFKASVEMDDGEEVDVLDW